MHIRNVLLLLVLLIAGCTRQEQSASTPLATTIPTPQAEEQFQNPVLRADFPDPDILQVGDTYYAYATNGSGANIQTASSTDLIHWERGRDALPAIPGWAKPGGSLVWAPEVMQINQSFVLYYTARDKQSNRQCVGVATSQRPEGPFKDTRDAPLVCQAKEGGTIDPSPFRDGERLYLYFKNDGNCCSMPTYLYVQELTLDGLGLIGEPVRLVRNDQLWEGRVIEAPTMVRHGDSYYLFFSANDYAGLQYAIGYASCKAPTGPCEDAPENPILKSKIDKPPLVIGPGHQDIIQIGDQTWIVYHAWEVLTSGTRGSRRFMWLDRLDWSEGHPKVLGPTVDPQPAPKEK